MLKLTVGVLAVVLASSAGAAGWRSMTIDASTEVRFDESVLALQEKLPRVRRHVFEQSLKDIWAEGTKAAAADEREYTINDYLQLLDGLGYKEIVTFTDPTGDTAKRYFDQAYARIFGPIYTRPPGGAAGAPRGPTYDPPREAGQSRVLDAGQTYRANNPGTHF